MAFGPISRRAPTQHAPAQSTLPPQMPRARSPAKETAGRPKAFRGVKYRVIGARPECFNHGAAPRRENCKWQRLRINPVTRVYCPIPHPRPSSLQASPPLRPDRFFLGRTDFAQAGRSVLYLVMFFPPALARRLVVGVR